MVDRMQKAGLQVETKDEALAAEAEDIAKTGPQVAGPASAAAAASAKPGLAGGTSDAERQAAAAANRARMVAQQQKR